MKKIDEHVAANGIDRTEVWYDEVEDRLVHNYVQNTFDDVLESNKREFSLHGPNTSFESEVANKVASIPLETVLRWKKEGLDIFDNSPETQRKLKQRLNSPEYQFLRTRPGRI